MSTKHRYTMQENIVTILSLCRQKPRTLHFVKDKFNFSNQQLNDCMSYLIGEDFIIVNVVKGDGRGTKQISTTDKGKQFLITNGVKYLCQQK